MGEFNSNIAQPFLKSKRLIDNGKLEQASENILENGM